MTAYEAPRGLAAADSEPTSSAGQPPPRTSDRAQQAAEPAQAQRPLSPQAQPQRQPNTPLAPDDPMRRPSPPPRAAPLHESGSTTPSTVLPDGRLRRPAPPRAFSPRAGDRASSVRTTGAATTRARKVRLALKRIDPWSVFLFSLLASVFAGLAVVVAVAALYFMLGSLGVVDSVNELVGEVTGDGAPLITASRFLGGAAVLAAVNVVLLTLLATLSALLYNVCASFTGGIELTLGERDG